MLEDIHGIGSVSAPCAVQASLVAYIHAIVDADIEAVVVGVDRVQSLFSEMSGIDRTCLPIHWNLVDSSVRTSEVLAESRKFSLDCFGDNTEMSCKINRRMMC